MAAAGSNLDDMAVLLLCSELVGIFFPFLWQKLRLSE
jgi:hypothetical protein